MSSIDKAGVFYLLILGPVSEPVLFMLEKAFAFYIYLDSNDYIDGKQ